MLIVNNYPDMISMTSWSKNLRLAPKRTVLFCKRFLTHYGIFSLEKWCVCRSMEDIKLFLRIVTSLTTGRAKSHIYHTVILHFRSWWLFRGAVWYCYKKPHTTLCLVLCKESHPFSPENKLQVKGQIFRWNQWYRFTYCRRDCNEWDCMWHWNKLIVI